MCFDYIPWLFALTIDKDEVIDKQPSEIQTHG